MALRSLGSTLISKTSPGAALRSKDENRMQGAVSQSASQGQPENVVRQTVQTPLEKSVPEGTQKVVSMQPTMQPRLEPAQGAAQAQGLLPQMGGAAQAAAGGQPISSGNAPAPSSPSAPRSQPTGLRSAQASSVAAPAPKAMAAKAYQPQPEIAGGETTYKTAPGESYTSGSFLSGILPTAMSLGARSMAGGENNVVPKNASQAIAGIIGDWTGNQALKNYSTNTKVTNSGVGSLSNPVASVKAAANTVAKAAQPAVKTVQQTVQKAVQQATNFLRSFFKKR